MRRALPCVGADVDVGLRSTIMPGFTWTPWFGEVSWGDAYNTDNRNAQDAFALINRVIYTFRWGRVGEIIPALTSAGPCRNRPGVR